MLRRTTEVPEGVMMIRGSRPAAPRCALTEGLVARTFAKWERRLRRKEGTKGQFVELSSPPKVSGPWAVEVEFPNGVRLRVRG